MLNSWKKNTANQKLHVKRSSAHKQENLYFWELSAQLAVSSSCEQDLEGGFYWLPSSHHNTGLSQRSMRPGQVDKQGSVETHFTRYWHICGAHSLSGRLWVLVAGGDWSYSVWRDVTCSPTPHDRYTQTPLTHTCTHTPRLPLCLSLSLSLLLSWPVRVIHFVEHLSRQQRNAVTGSLQMPTGGWECPHRYRRQTRACMPLPECCCLMVFWMTYISLPKIFHIGPNEIMDH